MRRVRVPGGEVTVRRRYEAGSQSEEAGSRSEEAWSRRHEARSGPRRWDRGVRPIGDSRRQARGLKRRSHGPVRRARGPRAASCRACRDPSESRPPGTTCVTTGDLVARPFIENRRPRPRLNERSWCTGVSRPRCRDRSTGAARCSRPPTDLLLSATGLHRRRPRGAQDLRHNCTYSMLLRSRMHDHTSVSSHNPCRRSSFSSR